MSESVVDQALPSQDAEIENEAALTTASGLVFTPLDPLWLERRDRLRQELRTSQAQRRETEASLTAERQEVEASLMAERQEVEASLTAKYQELESSLTSKCEDLAASLDATHEKLAGSHRDLLLASRRERDARSELTWLHMTALEPSRQRVAELEHRLEESEKSRQRAEADLRLALESTSWRLTAPLRAVADWLRGKRSPTLADIDQDRPL